MNDILGKAKAVLEGSERGTGLSKDFMLAAAARTLIPELVEEIEQLRAVQGLSVDIPGYGTWGSETLLYLFQDFGIQMDDGYHSATERQGDLLAEVSRLRARETQLRALADQHVGAPCDCNAIAHQFLAVLDEEAS